MTQFIQGGIFIFVYFPIPLMVIMCSLFSRSTWCSRMVHVPFICGKYMIDRATINRKGSIKNAYNSYVCRVTLPFVGLLYLGHL